MAVARHTAAAVSHLDIEHKKMIRVFMNRLPMVLAACIVVSQIANAQDASGHLNQSPSTIAVAAASEQSPSNSETDTTSETGRFQRAISYAGKYHLLVIHFPIAFLLAAAVFQLRAVVFNRADTLAIPMLGAGAAGAILAAVLGWMLASDSVYFGDDEKLLLYHRWLGISTAAFSSIIFLLRKRLSPRIFAVLTTVAAALVGLAAHFGGSLVRGADFLTRF